MSGHRQCRTVPLFWGNPDLEQIREAKRGRLVIAGEDGPGPASVCRRHRVYLEADGSEYRGSVDPMGFRHPRCPHNPRTPLRRPCFGMPPYHLTLVPSIEILGCLLPGVDPEWVCAKCGRWYAADLSEITPEPM